jgi:transcription initiation factor IIF auxiliary subunit
VQALATLADGTSRRLAVDFTLAPPTRRNLLLVQSDRYFGNEGGRPTWEWTVRLQGDAVDLADVANVTYHLHPSFPNPDRTVTGAPENGFALTTRGWGTFTVGATIRFHDGSTLRRSVDLEFRDPVRDTLTLTNRSRYAGYWDGQNRWQWTAYLDGPLGLLRRIRRVSYRLHPTFHPSVRTVEGTPEYGFPLSTNGWGTFEIGAEIVFDDGTVRTLTHELVFEDLPPGAPANEVPPGGGGDIPDKGGGDIPRKGGGGIPEK